MSGKNSHLSPLAQCKQLLLVESELNRTQLLGDLSLLAADARELTARLRSLGSLAALPALLLGQAPAPSAKYSWLQTLFKGTAWLPLFSWYFARRAVSKK